MHVTKEHGGKATTAAFNIVMQKVLVQAPGRSRATGDLGGVSVQLQSSGDRAGEQQSASWHKHSLSHRKWLQRADLASETGRFLLISPRPSAHGPRTA